MQTPVRQNSKCTLPLPHHSSQSERTPREGFPGGPRIKNPPANAGDTGSIPGLGRSHMPQGSYACIAQLLSPRSSTRVTTTETMHRNYTNPRALEPVLCNKTSHPNVKSMHRNSTEQPLLSSTREGPPAATKTQNSR